MDKSPNYLISLFTVMQQGPGGSGQAVFTLALALLRHAGLE